MAKCTTIHLVIDLHSDVLDTSAVSTILSILLGTNSFTVELKEQRRQKKEKVS